MIGKERPRHLIDNDESPESHNNDGSEFGPSCSDFHLQSGAALFGVRDQNKVGQNTLDFDRCSCRWCIVEDHSRFAHSISVVLGTFIMRPCLQPEIFKLEDARSSLMASIQSCNARSSHFGFLVGKAALQCGRRNLQLPSAHRRDNRPL